MNLSQAEFMSDPGPDDVMDTLAVTHDPSVSEGICEVGDDSGITSPDRHTEETRNKSDQETTEHPENEDKDHNKSLEQPTNSAERQTPAEQERGGIGVGVDGCTGTTPKSSQPDFSTEKTRMEPETESDEPLKLDVLKRSNSTILESSQADGPEEIISTAHEPSDCRISPPSEMNQEGQSLTIVVFGNISAVCFGDENILLGQEHIPPDQAHLPIQRTVSGRIISVINMLDLHEGELYLDPVDDVIDQLLKENNIHSFVFALKLGQLTDDDKLGLEWLQSRFGESVLPYVMILFTYEREEDCDTIIDDLKDNSVLVELLKKCGDRYHTFSKSMNNQSEMRTLVEKIDHLVSDNNQHCYTADMYHTGLKFTDQHQSSFQYSDNTNNINVLKQSEEPKEVETSTEAIKHFSLYKTPEANAQEDTICDSDMKSEKNKEEPDPSGPGRTSFSKITEVQHQGDNVGSPAIKLDPNTPRKGAVADLGAAEDGPGPREEDKLQQINSLFHRLNLGAQHTLKTADVLKITAPSLTCHELCEEKDLAHTFLQRLLMMDYTARYISVREQDTHTSTQQKAADDIDVFAALFGKETLVVDRPTQTNTGQHSSPQIHPMDIQMVAFHSADQFLRQLMVTKLSQCQYAVPLIVPNPFTGELEFPLWTLRQIKKTWNSKDSRGVTSKTKPMYEAETPMVAFLRLGSVSSSKSQLINSLISERHRTFFDRNCPQSSKTRLLLDGVVEIAWYCPSVKNSDGFSDCTAFCNLHGDAGVNCIQRDILLNMSTVNIVLLPQLGKGDSNMTIVKDLSKSPKPLIFVLTDDDITVQKMWEGKYKLGVKNRSQFDVAKELRRTIQECCTKSTPFKLENVGQHSVIVDEDVGECQSAKEAATRIMSLLQNQELANIKAEHLPCQGQLWHDWCQKNKNLYRLMGHLEKHKTSIKHEMYQTRSQQKKCAFSPFMKLVLDSLNMLRENERVYFLKWVGILLDRLTSDYLSELHHAYNEKWSIVLDLKKHNKSALLTSHHRELEKISEDMNAATFGVEHIIREMGQIYESYTSIKSAEDNKSEQLNVSSLPQRAAEIVISGYPMELMDGDAGHVPLVWVSAVLDELIKILGDQRVFVLSVLGIQSSGKSTMLNAMFGLQFAVSAGRCTRGAFMQLVKVSEEMKAELKFDYILVVDTEGLRAVELTGIATIHHDNELATFVIGLGNLTLINIFGENPAEMQDILQIVVQAFLRMKKVRLRPSCMFVHQNVGDITAGEKNMEGRRRLLGKLDEMTKLAAKEEVSEAECFSDIIAFNVQTDVKYFAQLWEGSPPMAPPNPSYSENIHELKRNILSKISTNRGVTLSQFKASIGDLWNALLNENFVFSFRNTLEVAAYRKLEHEYSKWTWSLRSAMMALENKLHNRVANEKSLKVEKNDIVLQMKETKKEVDESVNLFFSEDHDKDILIQWRDRFEKKIVDLYSELVEGTKRKLDNVCQQKIAKQNIDDQKIKYENKLFKLSKELALSLKKEETDQNALENNFNDIWSKWVTELTQDAPSVGDIDIWGDVINILTETYELSLVCERQNQVNYKKFDVLGNYSDYVIYKKPQEPIQASQHPTEECEKVDSEEGTGVFLHLGHKMYGAAKWVYSKLPRKNKKSENEPKAKMLSAEDNDSDYNDDDVLRALAVNAFQKVKKEIQGISSSEVGYNHSYIQQIIESVKISVIAHESKSQYMLKKEFTVDLCLYVCDFAAEQFTELHKKFKEANDVKGYLEKQKPQYLKVFKNYCSGATSTAVFAQFIVQKLEPSILQAAYDQTAIDLTEKMKRDVPAFSGNRSNLEKYILTSLAEEENFENYIEYIHKPKEHFNHFITKEVNNFIKKCPEVTETLKKNISSKGECVMAAVNEATVEDCGGNVDTWLQHLSIKLKDELQFKEQECVDQKEITDLGFLQKVVKNGLKDITSKLSSRFQCVSDLNLEMFRKKPDQILIEHLCRCCWEQCPFCNAICTNTMEDHTGDHMVRFHHNCGINGWSFKFSDNLGIDFCTTAVSSDLLFRTSAGVFPFKEYRKAGGEHARWNITPDNSEMPYWKWFVCRFQENLENHYKKRFMGNGAIPPEWRNYTKDAAIKSLCEL
ncbi:interferon-induced very large GTPase 1-like isoform X1 [Brachyhypopomus gauderio]|uniref:interferon-induced very large GTPase 1-like isoform X1 n=2 Tax=Brachyhypopomus gauderio TaxID=698409 RepID=UPI0040427C81